MDGDTNNVPDTFVKDTVTGTTTRVSTASDGTQGDNHSSGVAISADGRYVVFQSSATNLVDDDTNGQYDIFIKDTLTGSLTRVSTTSDGAEGDGKSQGASISADGRYVFFYSQATNLVDGDTNGAGDVFVKDLETGVTTRVSTERYGTEGNGTSGDASISADGRYVAFSSSASNLIAGDTNGHQDIFVKDMLTGAIARVSTARDGAEANYASSQLTISADGSTIAFSSSASNLVANDLNGTTRDVFVVDNPLIHGTNEGAVGSVSGEYSDVVGGEHLDGKPD